MKMDEATMKDNWMEQNVDKHTCRLFYSWNKLRLEPTVFYYIAMLQAIVYVNTTLEQEFVDIPIDTLKVELRH